MRTTGSCRRSRSAAALALGVAACGDERRCHAAAPARRRRRHAEQPRALRQPGRRRLERAGRRAAGLDRRVPGRQPRRHDRLRPGRLRRRPRAVHRRRHRRTAAPTRRLKDDELTGAQKRCGGADNLVEIPVYISPIAVIYNLEGVDEPAALAGDAGEDLQAGDQDLERPGDQGRQPGRHAPGAAHHRREPLRRVGHDAELHGLPGRQAAPDVWTFEADQDWPVKGGEAAQGTSGVVDAVKNGKGTIGYADESQAGELGKSPRSRSARSSSARRPRPRPRSSRPPRRPTTRARTCSRTTLARTTTEAGDVPDRPRLLRDRLHEVRRRRPGRARQGLPRSYVISPEGQEAGAQERRLGADQRRAALEDPARRRRDRGQLSEPDHRER